MFEEIFKHRIINEAKLAEYGFAREGGRFTLRRDVMDGEFTLTVTVEDGEVRDTELVEKETGGEYVLYKTGAQGVFVGAVRKEIERVIGEITDACCDPAAFKSDQARKLCDHVRARYASEPEYLWGRFPDYAVWRRGDNRKWFCVIAPVSKRKLGIDSDETAEIIDLRMDQSSAVAVLADGRVFPGWHMNKKSWYTVVLDGSIPDDELFARVAESYALAGKESGRKEK